MNIESMNDVAATSGRAGPVAGPVSGWSEMYRVAGWAAVAVIALIPVQLAAFVMWPPPTTAAEAFAMFREDPLGGLLAFDLLFMASWMLSVLVFVGLYLALRSRGPARMAIALGLELCAFAIYFSSNTAFSLLTLSDQYAAAATDVDRSVLLGAGTAMLALYTGTAFNVSYVLSGAAALLAGSVMVASPRFGRTAAYAMIAYGVLQVPPTVGGAGMAIAVISLIPMILWLSLVARALLRLPMRVDPPVAAGERRLTPARP